MNHLVDHTLSALRPSTLTALLAAGKAVSRCIVPASGGSPSYSSQSVLSSSHQAFAADERLSSLDSFMFSFAILADGAAPDFSREMCYS